MLNEETANFTVGNVVAKIAGGERLFWLLEAFDDRMSKRQWFVVIGSGTSPFDSEGCLKRWMYAKSNDNGFSPQDFLNEEFQDQLAADFVKRIGL